MHIPPIHGLFLFTISFGYVLAKSVNEIENELDLIKDVEAGSKLFNHNNKFTGGIDSNPYTFDPDTSDDDNSTKGKRYSSFVRIGKKDNEKRLSSFMRIGRSGLEGDWSDDVVPIPSDNKRVSSFVRIGKGNTEYEDPTKRLSSFVRIGKNMANEGVYMDDNAKRFSSFVRIGKNTHDIDDQTYPEKRRISSFVRIGRGPVKRLSSFMRIGRGLTNESAQTDEKSTGDDMSSDSEVSKRGFIRIGKIPSSAFMRIGRKALLAQLMKDRYLRPSRLGQSSFVRIGKRDGNSDF
ncbi:hypothetical protein FSP39_009554 [Pinctada imbricata]|uniref:Uncharacterized protein n=1 Tax=Pinctada imbricata TaxID=66713 RepID=A0AA88YBU8_PINIB|nr:hypothetical protein FSP39_009554 [Pinctada imbricata]